MSRDRSVPLCPQCPRLYGAVAMGTRRTRARCDGGGRWRRRRRRGERGPGPIHGSGREGGRRRGPLGPFLCPRRTRAAEKAQASAGPQPSGSVRLEPIRPLPEAPPAASLALGPGPGPSPAMPGPAALCGTVLSRCPALPTPPGAGSGSC